MAAPQDTLSVRVDLPWSSESGAVPDERVVSDELRLLWIVEQVRLRRFGVGKAAELAAMPRAAFMRLLGEHGVPSIDYPAGELQDELDRVGST